MKVKIISLTGTSLDFQHGYNVFDWRQGKNFAYFFFIVSSKMNTAMVVAKCMERRGVFPLMVIQKRFKGNKQKLKMKTDDSGSKTGDRSGSQKVLFPEISLVPNIQGSTTTSKVKGKKKKQQVLKFIEWVS